MAWTFRGTCQEELLDHLCSQPQRGFQLLPVLLQLSTCSQRPKGQKPNCPIALPNTSILPKDLMFDPMGTETSACDGKEDSPMWGWGWSLFLPKHHASCWDCPAWMRGCRSNPSFLWHRSQMPLPGCPDPSVAALQQLLEQGDTGRECGRV